MSNSNAFPASRKSSSSDGLLTTGIKRPQNATEALQMYIEQFSNPEQTNPRGTPNSGCYGSSNVSLLSTKPKPFFSARKAANSTGKPREMADDLVQWVNESYSKDLQRKIVPFGQRSCSSVETNDLESRTEGGNFSDEEVSTILGGDVQLSSLPSPGGSVLSDLDSNVESVNTEILVKSFHDNVQSSGRGTVNHPSWVEELVTPKHYPSWLDEVGQSLMVQQETKPNVKHGIRNRLSRSLSPSLFQEHPHATPSSILSTSLQEHPIQTSDTQRKKGKAWDLESTDTEVLISESIYGRQPVNMGGTFHNSLYHDRKINQLHDHSVKKFAKDVEQSLLNEISFVESNSVRKKTGERPSTKTFTNTMPQFKTSIPKPGKKSTERFEETLKLFYPSKDPQRTSDSHLRQNSPGKSVWKSTARPSSLGLSKGKGFESVSEMRKNSTDSSNTDRLMRKSPTGIEMVKQDYHNIKNSIEKNDGDTSTQPSTVRRSRNARSPGYNNDVERERHIRSQREIRPQHLPFSSQSLRTLEQQHPPEVIHPTNVKGSPRLSASDELQRIIDFAENNSKQALRKDHYLNGKVSKKDLNFQNHRVVTSDGLGSKRTTPITSTSIKEHSFSTRLASRNLSPARLVPSDRYHQRSPPRNGNAFSNNYRSVSYEKNSLRRRIPWNSDPTKSIPGGKIRHDKPGSRSRTKSAPGVARNAHNTNDRIFRNADYVNKRRILDANYADERESLLDDTESVDTEVLVVRPPMPLFDVSPSLSTASPESEASSGESGNTMIENLALRTSLLATDSDFQLSETSYKELPISPRNDKERSREWIEDDPSRAEGNNRINPGIITSFIEDCMTSSQQSISDCGKDRHTKGPEAFFKLPEYSVDERSSVSEGGSQRPVETLKKMLFTVQRLANSSEEGSGNDANDHSFETQSETLTEEILSDILSTASRNEGQDSLSRAYYHLARLKRLVSASQEVAEWR